ncbi:dTMP kinase [Pseudonocardia sp. HH130630-07]|uniref:dTMP kinase n=1 Tax=Pseudonocardia sp. HH130630-07 TaxID=1690815 RepID=UPI0012E9DC4F|nr:thymidylate kinase [Pseudonocardia sp. HH130630-07]
MTRPPLWVSLEGANGVGKTYLAPRLAARLTDRVGRTCLLSELTDGGGDTVTAAVIGALAGGRSFLRTGHPATETLALLALKVREHELVAALPDPPAVVIEDRGVDTVAAYQAAVCVEPPTGRHVAGDRTDVGDEELRAIATAVYDTMAPWRPLPDLTILLTDDAERCARRFAEREGRALTEDEHLLVERAARIYSWRAELEPQRIRRVDVVANLDPVTVIEQLVTDALVAQR